MCEKNGLAGLQPTTKLMVSAGSRLLSQNYNPIYTILGMRKNKYKNGMVSQHSTICYSSIKYFKKDWH
jgi:hypothetical protein